MTTEERFEHIENALIRITEAQASMTESHKELETLQVNTQKAIDRFVEETTTRGKAIDEKIANLTILVDRLIARDLQ